jgi:hypothetical protein
MAYSNGQEIVIADTGTDDIWPDSPSLYGTELGATTSPQAELAIAFYKAVKDANPGTPAWRVQEEDPPLTRPQAWGRKADVT